jgi:hypothetical protein
MMSIVFQAAGGAIASIESADSSEQQDGIWTIVAGVSFQSFSLLICSTCAADFYFSFRKAKITAGAEEAFNPPFTSLRSKPMFKFFSLALNFAVHASS